MDNNKQQLMKHFATVLRNRALGKQTDNLMSKNLAFYFSRKELIELVKRRFGGSIPKEHNLVELENKELLALIGDEMYIISYVTEKWCGESPQTSGEPPLVTKKETPVKDVDTNISKSPKKKTDDKTGKTT